MSTHFIVVSTIKTLIIELVEIATGIGPCGKSMENKGRHRPILGVMLVPFYRILSFVELTTAWVGTPSVIGEPSSQCTSLAERPSRVEGYNGSDV